MRARPPDARFDSGTWRDRAPVRKRNRRASVAAAQSSGAKSPSGFKLTKPEEIGAYPGLSARRFGPLWPGDFVEVCAGSEFAGSDRQRVLFLHAYAPPEGRGSAKSNSHAIARLAHEINVLDDKRRSQRSSELSALGDSNSL
jgi:hypothetical protein